MYREVITEEQFENIMEQCSTIDIKYDHQRYWGYPNHEMFLMLRGGRELHCRDKNKFPLCVIYIDQDNVIDLVWKREFR